MERKLFFFFILLSFFFASTVMAQQVGDESFYENYDVPVQRVETKDANKKPRKQNILHVKAPAEPFEKVKTDSLVYFGKYFVCFKSDEQYKDLVNSPFVWQDEGYMSVASKIELPERAEGPTNDFERVLNDKQIKSLDSVCNIFEKYTGCEVAIVTVDSSWISANKFDSLVTTLYKKWNIGEKYGDNGLLIGVCLGHRKIIIHTGTMLQKKFPAQDAAKIIDEQIIWQFRQKKYYYGIMNGLNGVIAKLYQTGAVQANLSGRPTVRPLAKIPVVVDSNIGVRKNVVIKMRNVPAIEVEDQINTEMLLAFKKDVFLAKNRNSYRRMEALPVIKISELINADNFLFTRLIYRYEHVFPKPVMDKQPLIPVSERVFDDIFLSASTIKSKFSFNPNPVLNAIAEIKITEQKTSVDFLAVLQKPSLASRFDVVPDMSPVPVVISATHLQTEEIEMLFAKQNKLLQQNTRVNLSVKPVVVTMIKPGITETELAKIEPLLLQQPQPLPIAKSVNNPVLVSIPGNSLAKNEDESMTLSMRNHVYVKNRYIITYKPEALPVRLNANPVAINEIDKLPILQNYNRTPYFAVSQVRTNVTLPETAKTKPEPHDQLYFEQIPLAKLQYVHSNVSVATLSSYAPKIQIAYRPTVDSEIEKILVQMQPELQHYYRVNPSFHEFTAKLPTYKRIEVDAEHLSVKIKNNNSQSEVTAQAEKPLPVDNNTKAERINTNIKFTQTNSVPIPSKQEKPVQSSAESAQPLPVDAGFKVKSGTN